MGWSRARQFLFGLALGATALALAWGTGYLVARAEQARPFSGITVGLFGLLLAVVVFLWQVIFGIVLLRDTTRRFIGYGMLAMSLVSISVVQICCQVIARAVVS